MILLHFHLNDISFAYVNANVNADADDTCFDADASG